MTSKRIIYNARASAKMVRRRIRRTEVRWVLAQGVAVDANQRRGQEPRHAKEGEIRGRTLRVIYIERATEIEIVSPHWRQKMPKPPRRQHEP